MAHHGGAAPFEVEVVGGSRTKRSRASSTRQQHRGAPGPTGRPSSRRRQCSNAVGRKRTSLTMVTDAANGAGTLISARCRCDRAGPREVRKTSVLDAVVGGPRDRRLTSMRGDGAAATSNPRRSASGVRGAPRAVKPVPDERRPHRAGNERSANVSSPSREPLDPRPNSPVSRGARRCGPARGAPTRATGAGRDPASSEPTDIHETAGVHAKVRAIATSGSSETLRSTIASSTTGVWRHCPFSSAAGVCSRSRNRPSRRHGDQLRTEAASPRRAEGETGRRSLRSRAPAGRRPVLAAAAGRSAGDSESPDPRHPCMPGRARKNQHQKSGSPRRCRPAADPIRGAEQLVRAPRRWRGGSTR